MTNNANNSKIKPAWLLTATLIVLLLPNIVLSVTEPMTLMARICNILLPAGVYMMLLSLLRNPARSVWMLFLLIFLSAFQLVLLYLYGHSIIAVDMFLNLVTTNSAEVTELLGSMLPAMIGVTVIFVPLLYVAATHARSAAYVISPSLRRLMRRGGLAAAIAGAACMAMCYAGDNYRAKDSLYPLNVCYNMYLAVDRSIRTAAYDETSRDFSFQAVATHQADSLPDIYVLVIGETARADNFGLYGYNRDTTPRLSAEEGLIKFPRAYTQSNTTHKSVPMLLSAACAGDYDRIYREKGIIAAFREAGFHTTFLSNQRPNHSFIDIFGCEADSWQFLKETLPADSNLCDLDMLEPVKQLLADRSRPQLIVLHSYGSHFNYHERYPRSMARFTPDLPDEVTPANRPSLLNAYDNTIAYTDHFLHSLITELRRDNATAALLYTSDHGENIFDDERELFLHASPRPSVYELHVPLLIWLSESYRERHPDTASHLAGNTSRMVQTSASVFHTMLDIAGISTPLRADSLSVASPRFTPTPYRYLTDRNEAVSWDINDK